ncbi:MAG: hypothetical protein QXN90_00730 [Zestosphaera sp.]
MLVTLAVGYAAIKYVEAESGMLREFKVVIKARLARVVGIYKLSLLILRKSFTYLIILATIFSVITSGLNTRYENNLVVIRDSSVASTQHTMLIRFSKPVSVEACSTLLSNLSLGGRCTYFYRVILDRPYQLEKNKKLIYVLIGVEETVLKDLSLNRELPKLTFGYSELSEELTKDTILVDDRRIEINLIQVDSNLLKSYTIFYKTPLVPIQGYVGTEPITVPLQHVLISTYDNLMELVGSEELMATDIVINNLSESPNLMKVFEFLEARYPVTEAAVAGGGYVTYVSETRIPTPDSLISAILSSITASIIIISIFSSTTPYLRELRSKISFMGFQPWAMTIIIVSYTFTSIMFPGLLTLTYVFVSMGSASTLNSVVTLIISWIASTTYIILRVKPEKLVTEAYMPPTPRYVLMSSITDINKLVEFVIKLIKTNEFFTVEDVEWRIEGDEAFIHAKMNYVDSWGSGIDLTIFINVTSERSYTNISSVVFGVEEVSESMSRSINALAISRIVGGVKAWEATFS